MIKKESKEKRTILIHEVHDMWPKTLVDVGGMRKSNPFVRLMQIGENYSYKTADYVASTLEFSEKHMNSHGLKDGKFRYIPNGISKKDWEVTQSIPKKHEEQLKALKKDNKFIVGYFGGFAVSNALDVLMDAAKKIKKTDIQFVLVGEGNQKKRLQKRIREEKIRNVLFLDPIPKKSIPDLLQYFDCVYMGVQTEKEIYKYGVSFTKMYDSMMAGCPILMNMSDVRTPVEQFECGIRCNVHDKDAICKGIEYLYSMSEKERILLGENGKRAVIENFEYGCLAEKYEQLFPKDTKNILLINHYAGSLEMGMDFRPFYLGREWVEKGYNVTILAADYSHLRRKNPIVNYNFQSECIEGINYQWIKTIKYSGNGLKRAITMLQFVSVAWFHAKSIAKSIQPDVIITASTYPLDMFASNRIKKYLL